MKRIALLLPALLISACGLRTPLEPPPGEGPPPRPLMAQSPLTTDEMLSPPPIARPDRIDELLRRSEPRGEDRFDLPPGDVATGVVSVPAPLPGDSDEEVDDRPD